MINSGERLYSALNTIIDISEEVQVSAKSNCFHDYLSWAKEFCTVHIGTSRRGGHDYAVSQLVTKRFNNPIIISKAEAQSGILYSEVKNSLEKHFKNCHFETFNNNHISIRDKYGKITKRILFATVSNLESIRGRSADAIIINTSTFLSKNQKEKIYKECILFMPDSHPFFFIFVQ